MTKKSKAPFPPNPDIDGDDLHGYTVRPSPPPRFWGLGNQKGRQQRIRFVGIDTDEVVIKAIEAGHIDGSWRRIRYGA